LVVALAAGGFAFGTRRLSDDAGGEPITVVVADLVNETKEQDLDGLAGMLITSLEQSRRLSVLTRSRMVDVLRQLDKEGIERIDEGVGREISRRVQATALVTGSVRRFGERYTVEVRVLDPLRNEVIFTARQEGRGKGSIQRMLDRLSEATRVALKENQEEIRRASLAVADRTTESFEAYQHYVLGEQLFARVSSNGDLDGVQAAAAEFQKAAELDPGFALAHYRLAFARLWIHDDPAGPITTAMRHLDRAPEKERLYIRACDARVQGRLDEAAALYRQVLAAYPNEKEALYALGDLEFHRRNLQEAVGHLSAAISIDPHFALAYEHLIDAMVRTSRLEQALTYATQYADRVPGEDSAHWLFAILLKARKPPEVEVALRRELALHPDRVEYSLASPRLKVLAHDWTGAEAELKVLRQSDRARLRNAAIDTTIWMEIYRGRFTEALKLQQQRADEALASGDPAGHALAVAEQASLVAWGWRNGDRLHELEGLVQGHPSAEFEVARAWSRLGQWGPAVKVLKRHPALVAADDEYPRVLELAEAGRYREAVKSLEAIAANAVDHEGIVHMEIAELAARHGDPDRVISELEALFAWKREPSEVLGYRNLQHPRGLFLLGKAWEAKGEPRKALRAYEELLELWKQADPELEDLREAQARVAALKRMGTR
jgi:tetratricopeptide (TPR) repeat protein